MAIAQLATSKKAIETDFMKYLILIYGREKIGKSTLFAQFPDIYFITTEPGTKGLEIYESQAESWEDIKAIVKLLRKTKKHPCVVFDTVDRAFDMCFDYVCKEMNIDFIGEDAQGKSDWGKSSKALKKEFTGLIHDIVRTGRGVYFSSHAKEIEIKTASGEKYNRIIPSMTNQARAVIEPLVDFFFYAEYMRDQDGNTIRVLLTQGDETIWAGSRKGVGNFPPIMPLLENGGYRALELGFRGKHPGISPSELKAARITTKTGAAMIRKMGNGGISAKPAPSPRKSAQPLKQLAARRK